MNQEKIDFIDKAFADISSVDQNELQTLIANVLEMLETGNLRVAELQNDNSVIVNQWVKKAILLYFKISGNKIIKAGEDCNWYDKVPLQFANFDDNEFAKRKIRAVPGAWVRKGAHIAENCVLMPSFVNIGANVGSGTMVDTWATIGSCAQIGKNCHISGGTGIGGVLEPLQANPVIIGDNCFIGARSEVAEGVIVESGSVIGMGVFLGASTKIVNRQTGEIYYGRVPAGSVVVAGTMPSNGGVNLYAAIIVKQVDEKTRSKTSINELLRE